MAEEVRVSYSAGMKVNIGNYQSVDVHFSESRSVEVDIDNGLASVDEIADNLKSHLKERVDSDLIEAVAEIKGTFGSD